MEVFPAPRSLTAEEQALVAFAQQGSWEAKKQVVEAQAHLGDPIAIAELEITPLKSGEKQDTNKDSNKER
jgi:RNA binding exosome subunit